MRIFYDHQVFSLQDAGGASRYHYELIRNLPAEEVAVELLMGANRSVMPFAELRRPRTNVLSLRASIRPGVGRYVINESFSAFIAPFCGKFDIYHPTLYRAIPWVRRRRMVVTHHDCTHERFPQLFANAATIVEAKRKLFAQADAIVCVSHSSRDDLLHFYDIAAEKTHVVPHGFSPCASRRKTPSQSPGGPTSCMWDRASATKTLIFSWKHFPSAAWLEAINCSPSEAAHGPPTSAND